jgi:hypothetical protein
MRKSAFAIVLVLASAMAVWAADGDGGYAGSFLQVPIGARPTAMGGAYIAIANDGAGALYNPAGLSTLQKKMFATSYRAMDLDRRLGYVFLAFPTHLSSALGFHYLYAGSGSVDARNTDGDVLGWELAENNHVFSVVFAKRFERWFSAGIKMNYMYTRYWEMSANTVGIDLGTMFYISDLFGRVKRDRMPVQDIRVGLTLRSIGAVNNWNSDRYVREHLGRSFPAVEQEDDYPIEFGIGVSGRLMDRRLLLATDVKKNTQQGAAFHAGAEYFIRPQFAVRAGFSDGRLTAGTGYVFRLSNHVLAVDYAFSTDKADEGSEHIFSFDILF